MKKVLVVLLALSLAFAFTACGDTNTADKAEADSFTAIPLGGDLGEYTLEGEQYGEYVAVDEADIPEELIYEDCQTQLYYSEGANIPYIAVYRWANTDGETIEDVVEYEISVNDADDGRTEVNEVLGIETGSFHGGWYIGEDYYYYNTLVMSDGDDMVELEFFYGTDEITLSDSGYGAYIPKGSADVLTDEEEAAGYYLSVEYDYDNLPAIRCCSLSNYEEDAATYVGLFDEFPISEEEWNNYDYSKEEDLKAYYKALGGTLTQSGETKLDDITVSYCLVENSWFAKNEGDINETAIECIKIGDTVYESFLTVDNKNQYVHGRAFANSIHKM